MHSPEARISVALITRNRPSSLEHTLRSWRRQTVRPFQIIISDDSDDNYSAAVERIALEFDCRYVKGPRRGLYANRNIAALACGGTHIMSADDDHTHPSDFIETVIADIAFDFECVWTYGERHPRRPDEPLIPPPELTYDNRVALPSEGSKSGAIADGSSLYPRTIFDKGLRYDETYPFGGLWYLWGRRLNAEGVRIRFSPRTFVWHDSDNILERSDNVDWHKSQIECNLYVVVRNAIRENRSLLGSVRALNAFLRAVFVSQSSWEGAVGVSISYRAALRAVRNAFTAV